MKSTLLGIDVGTSAVKAILFDLNGAVVASSAEPYPLLTPQPGWVEQDAEAVWAALGLALTRLTASLGEVEILALALAAQAGSIIPADLNGDPVYPMITWLDTRSQELTQRWGEDGTAAAIRRLSGWQPFAGLPLPSIGWLQRERPEVHRRAARWLGVADFLIHRLTGRFVTDLSAASELLLVDIRTGQWSDELCAIGGVNPANQAELGWAGRRLGALTPAAARHTGLPAGTPVIAAGNDQPCAGLGMGMTAPGQVMLSTGTAWVLMSVVAAETPAALPEWVNLYFHAAPQRRLGGQLVGGFGATVDWWARQLGAPEAAAAADLGPRYAELDGLVASSPVGANGLLFLPLGGPSQMVGAIPGGGYVNLLVTHSRADLARALLEGCAYEVRWALDGLRAAGIPVAELWLAGGANRSPVWPQILADVGGVPLQVAAEVDWAALGAAALAGWGVGAFSTLEAGIAALRPPAARLEPNPAHATAYAAQLAQYQHLAHALQTARA